MKITELSLRDTGRLVTVQNETEHIGGTIVKCKYPDGWDGYYDYSIAVQDEHGTWAFLPDDDITFSDNADE